METASPEDSLLTEISAFVGVLVEEDALRKSRLGESHLQPKCRKWRVINSPATTCRRL